MAQSYRDLTVWQRAMEMTVEVYALTKGFPREEIYGITSQLRRASVSVASNIAEGGKNISGRIQAVPGYSTGFKFRGTDAVGSWAEIGAWKRGLTEQSYEVEHRSWKNAQFTHRFASAKS